MDFKHELISALSDTKSGIQAPMFDLDQLPNGRVSGFLISPTFIGKDQIDRQKKLWDYLEKVFPREKTRKIAVLVTITPEEAKEDDE